MQLPERLYTEAEAAEICGVASVTLRKWRGEGRIEYTQLGTSIRYTASQITEFVERGKHPALCDTCKEQVRATA